MPDRCTGPWPRIWPFEATRKIRLLSAAGLRTIPGVRVIKNLLLPDPAESSGGAGAPSGPRTEPEAAQSAAPPAVVAPPAAKTVTQGEVTEETLKLKEQLAEKDRLLKQRETEVSESQQQVQTLKESIEQPKPVPVKKKAEAKPEAKPFRIGRFV